jgi:O-acetylhomoserine (thiol)-lyase
VVDAGRFDWALHADRFPQLAEPPHPGAGSFVERFGPGAYLAYLRSVIVLEYGPTVPPTSTFLLLHGIETLSVRMDRHVANAQVVAEWLHTRPEVARVHYPGLAGDPFHEAAARSLPKGAGSIVSIDLSGGRAAAARFIDALRLITPMTHIGDVRTLAIHLASTIHAKLSEEERREAGIGPGLVRLSIGLESLRDLLADLERGLAVAGV